MCTSSTFARNPSSSTVSDGDCTTTISASFCGPRSFSASSAAPFSESYWPPIRKSVVVALSSSSPATPSATTSKMTHTMIVRIG